MSESLRLWSAESAALACRSRTLLVDDQEADDEYTSTAFTNEILGASLVSTGAIGSVSGWWSSQTASVLDPMSFSASLTMVPIVWAHIAEGDGTGDTLFIAQMVDEEVSGLVTFASPIGEYSGIARIEYAGPGEFLTSD